MHLQCSLCSMMTNLSVTMTTSLAWDEFVLAIALSCASEMPQWKRKNLELAVKLTFFKKRKSICDCVHKAGIIRKAWHWQLFSQSAFVKVTTQIEGTYSIFIKDYSSTVIFPMSHYYLLEKAIFSWFLIITCLSHTNCSDCGETRLHFVLEFLHYSFELSLRHSSQI